MAQRRLPCVFNYEVHSQPHGYVSASDAEMIILPSLSLLRSVLLSGRLNPRNTQGKHFQNPNGHPLVKREYSNHCFKGVYWAESTPDMKTKQRTKTNKQQSTRQGLPDCETGIFREIPTHSWLLCSFISEINPRNI